MDRPMINMDPALWASVLETIIANREQFDAGGQLEAVRLKHQAGGVPVVLRFTVERDDAT